METDLESTAFVSLTQRYCLFTVCSLYQMQETSYRYFMNKILSKTVGYKENSSSTVTCKLNTWKDIPDCRHGKLFIGRPCKKVADDLLKLGRHQLKMVVAILTGHAPVKGRLRIMGLFNGDPSCRFCGMETETVQHITCCCKSLARQRYNVFRKLSVKPKEISTASVRDLCLLIRERGLLNLC